MSFGNVPLITITPPTTTVQNTSGKKRTGEVDPEAIQSNKSPRTDSNDSPSQIGNNRNQYTVFSPPTLFGVDFDSGFDVDFDSGFHIGTSNLEFSQLTPNDPNVLQNLSTATTTSTVTDQEFNALKEKVAGLETKIKELEKLVFTQANLLNQSQSSIAQLSGLLLQQRQTFASESIPISSTSPHGVASSPSASSAILQNQNFNTTGQRQSQLPVLTSPVGASYSGGYIDPHILAKYYYQQNNFQEAIKYWHEVLKTGSIPVLLNNVNYYLGTCYYKTQQYVAAKMYLSQTNPTSREFYETAIKMIEDCDAKIGLGYL